MKTQFFPHITVDQGVQFGKPVMAGTRVPVDVVMGHMAAGDTVETVMEEYALSREQVLAALKYAAKILAEQTIMVSQHATSY